MMTRCMWESGRAEKICAFPSCASFHSRTLSIIQHTYGVAKNSAKYVHIETNTN